MNTSNNKNSFNNMTSTTRTAAIKFATTSKGLLCVKKNLILIRTGSTKNFAEKTSLFHELFQKVLQYCT
jgi:hypothetical protein